VKRGAERRVQDRKTDIRVGRHRNDMMMVAVVIKRFEKAVTQTILRRLRGGEDYVVVV
jgi:hypothetical protein